MNDELHVIYLHGFLSSSQSRKAIQTSEYVLNLGCAERLLVPELTAGPADTIAELQGLIDARGDCNVGLIGSSLGGFYATCLAERNNLRAVVVNPAVRPHLYWRNYVGEHRNYYSGETQQVTEQHIAELEALDCSALKNPQNFMLLAQTGDEVLDYRMAEALYQEGTSIIQDGGNHSFENYADFLPIIFNFLAIKN